MDKLYIVIPAYNEAANIRQVVEEWYQIILRHDGNGESRLLVIDDGSKDETYQILEEMKKDRPLLLIQRKKNSGHGATLLYGYRYAIEQGAEYIFQTDSDGQTRPEEFQPFWEKRQDYDMIIGYRNKRQDGIARIAVTKVLKLLIRLCFGVSVTDANTPFRLMKRDILKEQLSYIPENFNLPNVLIAVIFEKKKKEVIYLPITFKPRQGGENSINLKKICGIGMRAVKDFIEINRVLENVEKGGSNEN